MVMKNLGFGPCLPFLMFWALLGLKKGVAPQRSVAPQNGVAPQNPTKMLTQLVDLFGHLLSRNNVSKLFDPALPLPLSIHYTEDY